MSAHLYDEALTQKIKKWYEGAELEIYSPADTKRLFEVITDKTDDNPIQLPIITISRNGGYTVKNTNKRPLTYEGLRITGGLGESNAVLYAIPIQLDYQLDIYTRYLKEADEFSRDLIFNIINHPTINLDIEYNGVQINHNATLRVAEKVADNSNVTERFVAGNFTRLTLDLNLDDAYLWNLKQKPNARVTNIEVEEGENQFVN